jgi:transcriptional regulator with XRE-family HTH domain
VARSISDVDSIAPALGHVIREHRLASAFSQEELTERAGLHWTYVSQMERGRPNISVDALRRIGRAVGTSGWSLLRESEVRRAC